MVRSTEDAGPVRNVISGSVSGDVVQAESVAIYTVDADQFVAGRDVHLHFRDGLRGARGVLPGAVADLCPYPGLAEFRPDQAAWFFGRRHLVAAVVQRLDQRVETGGALLVVAPSGAGKSSLLRAGVLPALASGAVPGSRAWPSVLMTPTEQPVQVLARYLATLAGTDPGRAADLVAHRPAELVARLRAAGRGVRLVVIVDQLEELFTACGDEWQRHAVLAVLDLLARRGPAGEPPVALVVYGLRADFYPRCAEYPPLRAAAFEGQVLVGPMSEEDLREAVLFPAQRAGLTVEPGLVELLLRDLGSATRTGQAGRLPLLAHALRVTWQQRHGSTLTVRGYQATGGIARAVATTAEDIFGKLTPQDQDLARSLFPRLVAIADGAEDTRRRVHRAQLRPGDLRLVDAFTHARLLTQTHDSVEITHEALLHGWPRLRDWITRDRAEILLRQQLTEAAGFWDASGHDPEALYRGARLTAAQEWAEDRADLSPAEHRFLRASTDAAQASLADARRTNRRLRRRLTAVALTLVLALAAGVVAFVERTAAEHEREQAVSRQLAADARLAMSRNPREAMTLALRAWRTAPTAEARGALLSTQSLPYAGRLSPGMVYLKMAASPDGALAAFSGVEGRIQLWDTATHTPLPTRFTGQTRGVNSIVFSPDGSMLATASMSTRGASITPALRVWDVRTGALTHTLPGTQAVAWRPDGRVLASVDRANGRDVIEWEPHSGKVTGRIAAPAGGLVSSLAYSPDGALLAMGREGGVVDVFRAGDQNPLYRVTLAGEGLAVLSVAFSDRGLLSAVNVGPSIRLWDAATGAARGTLGGDRFAGISGGVAFVPGTDLLATASVRGVVDLWDTSKRRIDDSVPVGANLTATLALSRDGSTMLVGSFLSGEVAVVRRGGRSYEGDVPQIGDYSATGVAVDPAGTTIASAHADGSIRHWDLGDRRARAVRRPDPDAGAPGDPLLAAVAFSPDGTEVRVAGDKISVWRPGADRPLVRSVPGRLLSTLAVSPDGRFIATPSRTAEVRGSDAVQVWTLPDLDPVTTVTPVGRAAAANVVRFTPDGRRLLAGVYEMGDGVEHHSVQVWDVPGFTARSALTRTAASVVSMDISPDGRTLATGHGDGVVRLWSADTGAPLREVGQPGSAVRALAFAEDGTLITGTVDDQVLRLWNSATGAVVAQIRGHAGLINQVVVTPDSRVVATASADSTVGLWDLDPEVVAARVCRILVGADYLTRCG
ncbi:WD40 repeat [Actinokineospora globicatena]|nr:WD40 repeat [Actinokineospora globicatena]GLW82313.1 hypothetical protein Aglo01_67940 [Actinokineospora globicatena]GLW89094.1 hypothetical protein Aglo02_67330 [Actinokineospora globicatena]